MGTDGRSPLGHKEEVRPGVWRVAVSCGYRADGAQRRVWRTVRGTARDADVEMARIAGEMGAEPWLGDRMTLEQRVAGSNPVAPTIETQVGRGIPCPIRLKHYANARQRPAGARAPCNSVTAAAPDNVHPVG